MEVIKGSEWGGESGEKEVSMSSSERVERQ
jgi:hypothetical protein